MAITNSIVYKVVLNSCVLRSNIFVTFVFRHHSLLPSSFSNILRFMKLTYIVLKCTALIHYPKMYELRAWRTTELTSACTQKNIVQKVCSFRLWTKLFEFLMRIYFKLLILVCCYYIIPFPKNIFCFSFDSSVQECLFWSCLSEYHLIWFAILIHRANARLCFDCLHFSEYLNN